MMFFAALSAVALLVLCIACANVADLSLARASVRRREMAVRLALGATRGHLLRQMLTESVLLAMGGGVLGVALSLWATRGLSAFRLPVPVPLDLTVSVDWRVLLYTFALSLGAGLLLPGFGVDGGAAGDHQRAERRGYAGPPGPHLEPAQYAGGLADRHVAGFVVRHRPVPAQPGERVEHRNRIPLARHSDDVAGSAAAWLFRRTVQFLTVVGQRVAALPGVISVASTDAVPLSEGHRSDAFQVEGRANYPEANQSVDMYMATPGYFETIGTARIAGRDFANEGAGSTRVAIVNETFARSFFRSENPLGQRVIDGDKTYQIVGVVGNIKSRTLGEDVRPVLYRSLAQDLASDPSFSGYAVLVRFAGDPGALSHAMRREIHALDPTLAIFDVATMEEHLRDALFLPRLAGTLFGIFGLIGLALAAVGLYGVMSYWVSRRTREIGIRLAVGARIGEVQRLIVREGMVLTVIGVVPGLAAAWALAKLFTSFLYGVPAHDGLTFAVVPLFLGAVALLACWIPARRAAKVDPGATLRHE